MGVKVKPGADSRSVDISIEGSFQFALRREFYDTYAARTEQGCVYRVNLSATQYMDSSALGMLLLLKEHADKYRGSVVISGVSPAIRRILEIASFDKIFQIQA